MGMIRVSDQVEKRLKEVADGRSMNATIEKMLAYCSSPEGFCPVPQESQTNYEPYLLEQMNKRFDKIESMLDDTLVDRIEAHKTVGAGEFRGIEWPQIQDLYSDFPDEREWEPGVRKMWGEADSLDLCSYFTDGKYLYLENYGNKTKIMKMTPKLEEYLK